VDTDLLPGKTEVTHMNGLTFYNNVPCMITDVVEVGDIIGLVAWNRKRRRQSQFWVHPIYSDRLSFGRFYTSFERCRNYPDKFFFSYYKMSVSSFDELLALVGPSIAKEDSNWRRSVESSLAVSR
jgi:hypothetical protein